MVVEFVLLHFGGGDLHAALDLVFGVRRTATQALLQLFQCAGHDKDSDDVALEQWVGQRGLAHLRGALHVDVEQEVGADREFVLHLALERAVDVAVHVGVFVEMPFGFDLLLRRWRGRRSSSRRGLFRLRVAGGWWRSRPARARALQRAYGRRVWFCHYRRGRRQ